MRTSILLGAVILLCAACNSSEPTSPTESIAPDDSTTAIGTKLERFTGKVGSVIIRGATELGRVRGQYGTFVEVEALEIVNAASGDKEYGARVNVAEGSGRFDSERTHFIDYDELQPLLDGISFISSTDTSATALEDYEAYYLTRGDLKITKFINSNGTAWMGAGSASGIGANAFFTSTQFDQFVTFVEQAIDLIEAAKMSYEQETSADTIVQ